MHTHPPARTHTHTHSHTYITQCQIKITQGNFQGCIYNHNDKYSISEVAEVREQTTAQAMKQVLALTPSPLFGDTSPHAQGHVLKRHVFHREWRSVVLETWQTTLQSSSCASGFPTIRRTWLKSLRISWTVLTASALVACGSSADSSVSRALKQAQSWQLKMLLVRAVCHTSLLDATVGRKVYACISPAPVYSLAFTCKSISRVLLANELWTAAGDRLELPSSGAITSLPR